MIVKENLLHMSQDEAIRKETIKIRNEVYAKFENLNYNTLDNAIKTAIQNLIKDNVLSLRQLAIKCDVAPSTVSRALSIPDSHFSISVRKKLLNNDLINKQLDAETLSNLKTDNNNNYIEVPLVGYVRDGYVIPNVRSAHTFSIPYMANLNINKLYAMGQHPLNKNKFTKNFTALFTEVEVLPDYDEHIVHIILKESKEIEKRLSFVGKLLLGETINNKLHFNLRTSNNKEVLVNHEFDDIADMSVVLGYFNNYLKEITNE